MTITDRLLITIVGGIVLWFLKEAVVYVITRNRVLSALCADMVWQQEGADDDVAAIRALFEDLLKEGKKIPFPLRYEPGDFDLLNAYRPKLQNYLRVRLLIRTFKFYDAIDELQAAMKGFCDLLCDFYDRQHVLEENDIKHLKIRLARMESLGAAITKEKIRKICDLPSDYRAVQNLESAIKQCPDSPGTEQGGADQPATALKRKASSKKKTTKKSTRRSQ